MSALMPAPEGPEPEDLSTAELRTAYGIATASRDAAIERVNTVHRWMVDPELSRWPGEVWLTVLSRAREVEVATWTCLVADLRARLVARGETP